MNVTVGYAFCGSFCSLSKSKEALINLKNHFDNIIPIMSETTYSTDTRFYKASDFNREIEEICQNKIIHTIAEAEPIGPKKLLDILVISPCTGNTLAKLALGIADTSVTLAAKAHLRNNRPVVIGISSNDSLSSNAKNIGALLNYKNIYFIPYNQDDCDSKPQSMICDFSQTLKTIECALNKKQIQPIIYKKA